MFINDNNLSWHPDRNTLIETDYVCLFTKFCVKSKFFVSVISNNNKSPDTATNGQKDRKTEIHRSFSKGEQSLFLRTAWEITCIYMLFAIGIFWFVWVSLKRFYTLKLFSQYAYAIYFKCSIKFQNSVFSLFFSAKYITMLQIFFEKTSLDTGNFPPEK